MCKLHKEYNTITKRFNDLQAVENNMPILNYPHIQHDGYDKYVPVYKKATSSTAIEKSRII
jgi:hypothetical protein